MRSIVQEDQGHVDSIDRATYATCAVLIKVNHLTAEAMSIAKGIDVYVMYI